MAVARSSQIHMPYQIPGQKQRQWDDDGEIEDPDDPPPYIEEFCESCSFSKHDLSPDVLTLP